MLLKFSITYSIIILYFIIFHYPIKIVSNINEMNLISNSIFRHFFQQIWESASKDHNI